MSVERDRLLSVIEFSQQTAPLRSKSTPAVDWRGFFALYEHEIQKLSDIRINVNDSGASKRFGLPLSGCTRTLKTNSHMWMSSSTGQAPLDAIKN